jgi:hypothetical protein
MSQTLTISDDLYQLLEAAARKRGLQTIEQLLRAWQEAEDERQQRRLAVQRLDAVRSQLFATYGEMPDSTALIRQDRER